MLFLLRSSPGFEEQRKRLASRSLRPAYFEMLAAKQFFKAGFNIQARRETGTKGEDFDFSAIKGAETINVEVTALTATSFSENTILNALNQKRAQLPTDAPAVIYCMMPESWFPTPDNWNNDVPPVINTFLRGTRRINVVVAWTERRVSVTHNGEPGRALMVIRNAFANPELRKLERKTSNFLFGGKSSQQANLELASDNGLDKLMKEWKRERVFFGGLTINCRMIRAGSILAPGSRAMIRGVAEIGVYSSLPGGHQSRGHVSLQLLPIGSIRATTRN